MAPKLTDKTWAALKSEIQKTLDRMGGWGLKLDCQLTGRSASRAMQTKEERAVTAHFRMYTTTDQPPHDITITMRRRERAVDNLQAIATALEELRMARYHETDQIQMLIYRQLYPVEPKMAPPPINPAAHIPYHYQVLGLNPGAPLIVAEAAYKALARRAHPDAGGSTERMQLLNAAIEQVRKEKVK